MLMFAPPAQAQQTFYLGEASSSRAASLRQGVSPSCEFGIATSGRSSSGPSTPTRLDALLAPVREQRTPDLSPRPALSARGVTDSVVSQRTDSGVYYTASWGSPYPHSEVDEPQETPPHRRRRRTRSSEFGVDHPIFRVDVGDLQPRLPSPIESADGIDPQSAVSVELAIQLALQPLTDPFASIRAAESRRPTNGLDEAVASERIDRNERIERYLRRQVHSERGNWWSDDSASQTSNRSVRTAFEDRPTDEKDFWLGLDRSDSQETLANLPTVESAARGATDPTTMTVPGEEMSEGRKSKCSSRTVTPAAANDSPDKRPPSPAGRAGLLASRWADDQPTTATEPAVKTPRVDAAEERPADDPGSLDKTCSATTASKDEAGETAPPLKADSGATETGPIQPRTFTGQGSRRRVVWKGKACVIAPPFSDDRHPTSPAEWARRLQDWEDRGYDTRGFDRWRWQDAMHSKIAEGQSRTVYPSAEELQAEWEGRAYRVNIPDLKGWEAYVNELNEERLRALGVSSCPQDDPSAASAAAIQMDRHFSSPYPALPISPPPKVMSVASNRSAPPTNPFPLPFPGLGPSEASMLGVPMAASASLPALVPAFSVPGPLFPQDEQQLGLLRQTHQQGPSSHQGIWPAQPPYNILGATATTPFGALGSLPPLTTVLQPTALSERNVSTPASQADVAAKQLHHHRQLQLQQAAQQQFRQLSGGGRSPLHHELQRDHSDHDSTTDVRRTLYMEAQSNLGNLSPVAQEHGRDRGKNSPVRLRDDQYHLEVAIERQIAEEDRSRRDATTPFDSGDILPDDHDPTARSAGVQDQRDSALTQSVAHGASSLNHQVILHSPQPRGKPHSLSRDLARDFENAEGHIATPDPPSVDEASASRDPLGRLHDPTYTPSTRSPLQTGSRDEATDLSNSSSTAVAGPRLNVEAEEFKFDSSRAFVPGSFSFTGMDFQAVARPLRTLDQPRQTSQLSRPRVGAAGHSSTKLNVEAPTFKPRAPLPTMDFNFSSAFPLPVAPTHLYIARNENTDLNKLKAHLGSANGVMPKIFDHDIGTVPAKNSKAVPIIRPDYEALDNSSTRDDVEQEDDSGHITRSQGRQKKARRGNWDGDNAPEFADSTHPGLSSGSSPPLSAAAAHLGDPLLHGEAPVKHSNKGLDETVHVDTATAVDDSTTEQPLHESSPSNVKDREFEELAGQETEAVRHPNFRTLSSPAEETLLVAALDTEEAPENVGGSAIYQPTATGPSDRVVEATLDSARPAGDAQSHATKSSFSATAKPFSPRFAFDNLGGVGNTVSPLPVQGTPNASERGQASGEDHTSAPNKVYQVPSKSVNPLENQSNDATHHSYQSPRVSAVIGSSDFVGTPWDLPGVALGLPSSNDQDRESKRSVDLQRPESLRSSLEPSLDGAGQATGLRSDTGSHTNTGTPALRPLPQISQALSSHHQESDSSWLDRNAFATAHLGLASESALFHLKPTADMPVSDWDSLLSPGEEPKLQTRSQFFDGHVDRLLSRVLDQRLGPLEKSLQNLQGRRAMTSSDTISSQKRRSVNMEDNRTSDADDEDDDMESVRQQRARSPRRDRKLGTIKAAVLEAMEAHGAAIQASLPVSDISDIRRTLLEMKTTSDQQPSRTEGDLANFRSTVQELFIESMPMYTEAIRQLNNTEAGELRAKLGAAEYALCNARERVEEQSQSRTIAEEKVIELQDRIRRLEMEAAQQRTLAEERECQLNKLSSQKNNTFAQSQEYIESLKDAGNCLHRMVSDVSNTNELLENQLREARSVEERRSEEFRDMGQENNKLRKAVDALRVQLEESIKVRDGMRGKFEKLQADVAVAASRIEAEQASWRERDKAHKTAEEVMGARLESETRARERLERSIEVLEAEQREALKIQFKCEQLQAENANLETLANTLRLENLEHQKLVAKYQSEVNEAREAGRTEVQRVTLLMNSQVEVANSQVNMVRAELETQLATTKAELEHYKLQYDGVSATGRRQLEDAAAAKKEALATASEEAEASLQEQHRKYERHLEDLKFQHDLALQGALDDKQRTEAHLLDRLSLSNATTEHLQERISHLEEKLEIARTAASAAVQAAQHAKAPVISGEGQASSSSQVGDSGNPMKISPQALRESILVLQEQLQERENRIEKLEQELAGVDRDAPTKLKEQQAEIGWLRELLGVRISDLEEIIKSLSAPDYNRDAVKDAAIRLKANLDMQQQERERATTGRPRFPSMPSIASFTSPKTVLPLAAAWGNWRKGKDVDHENLPEAASVDTPTPSKSSLSQQSFFSGLLTPPSTHARRSPLNDTTGFPGQPSSNEAPGPQTHSPIATFRQQRPHTPTLPSTPTLLSHASYDQDAKSNDVSTEQTPKEGQSSSGDYFDQHRMDKVFGPLMPPQ